MLRFIIILTHYESHNDMLLFANDSFSITLKANFRAADIQKSVPNQAHSISNDIVLLYTNAPFFFWFFIRFLERKLILFSIMQFLYIIIQSKSK